MAKDLRTHRRRKDPCGRRLPNSGLGQHELEFDHGYTQCLRALELALKEHEALKDHSLPANVDGAIAAVCGDLGLPTEVADALLIISRVPGLAAHVLEEQRRESPMRQIDPSNHQYDGPPERRLPERRK